MNIRLHLQCSGSESAQNVTDFRYSSEVGPLELTEVCWWQKLALRWSGLELNWIHVLLPSLNWNRWSNIKIYFLFIKFTYSNCKIKIHIQTFQILIYCNIICFKSIFQLVTFQLKEPWHHTVNAIIKAFHIICNNFFNQEECFQPLSTSSNINLQCSRHVFCNCKRNSMCLKWHNTKRLKKSKYPPMGCLQKDLLSSETLHDLHLHQVH